NIYLLGCGRKCKETPLELVFVIDSSESVGIDNFRIIQNFVKTLADRIAVDLATARMGIINYSHQVEKVADLRQFSSKDDFKLAVDGMQYLGEGTYTATALQAANDMFKGARPGVKKVGLVITDGQTDSRDKKNLTEVVKEANNTGVETFVIGVVKKSDPNFDMFFEEMNLIATDPQHVYHFDDFLILYDILKQKLSTKICEDFPSYFFQVFGSSSSQPEFGVLGEELGESTPEPPEEISESKRDLEMKTQQLEIKLSNKMEEDIKKVRRKSTQTGNDLMRCVDLYNQAQAKWFEEMVTTTLELEQVEMERVEMTRQHLCQYTQLRHETDMFNQSTVESVDQLLRKVDPAKVREHKMGNICSVDMEI
ncbi:Collagen alpha-1(XXVIII) chain, partial [Sciurus carolinensis]|nr:Collagen alpha-1(XXVIII) chain [Sciurus carolinensis]